MDGYRDFTFDAQKFASLPSLVEDLHKHGQHYVMILVLGLSCSWACGQAAGQGHGDSWWPRVVSAGC